MYSYRETPSLCYLFIYSVKAKLEGPNMQSLKFRKSAKEVQYM